jgi:glycerol-3-phosphate acyltransferase PlsX
MRVAVDSMGGDFAPAAIVAGAVDAARTLKGLTSLTLVGDEAAVRRELALQGPTPPIIQVRHAGEVVGMEETPAVAIRRKKDSSINRAVDMVKHGEADAVFSAGNTGAAVVSTTLKLRTLEGVQRPAIATVIPTPTKPFVMIDSGANPDCNPIMFAQFAVMGCVYSREILGCPNPKVGLLSIGGEDSKGNEATKDAFKILEKSSLSYHGNVESSDIFNGVVDVVVCDGFVGNIVLKTSESVARTISRWIREECSRNPLRMLGALLARGAFGTIRRRSDPAMYGGAPLLGVRGSCIIGHGSSSARAVLNGIRVAAESVSHHINQMIVDEIRNLGKML